MDTFRYTNDSPNKEKEIKINMKNGTYRLCSTGGGWENYSTNTREEFDNTCTRCSEGLYDNNTWMSPDEEPYCETCFDRSWAELDYYFDGEDITGAVCLEDLIACYDCGDYRLVEHSFSVEGRRLCGECNDTYAEECICCSNRHYRANMMLINNLLCCNLCRSICVECGNHKIKSQPCQNCVVATDLVSV
ncbi:MAG TPA: hypothetical protein VEP90_00315, partial [Methylomirabilota bacterium]|nr:hypothetical protein [Methylomirabilota bacterium]